MVYRNTKEEIKKFNLIWFFSIASFIVIAIGASVSGWIFARIEKNEILKRAEGFANKINQQLNFKIFTEFIFPTTREDGYVDLKEPRHLQRLENILWRNVHEFKIGAVLLFDTKGEIVYCTNHSLIGFTASDNPGVVEALRGKVHSMLKLAKGTPTVTSISESSYVLETYSPSRKIDPQNLTQGEIMGVIETYQDADDIIHQISKARNKVILLSASTMGTLFLVLFLLAIKAHRTITLRTNMLIDVKDEIRRKNEELEVESQKAREASRLKSVFLANMSHELRTPLNAIIGFSEVLHDKSFGGLNPKQERYVNNIHKSGQHLLQLINDILDLSKIESGKMELHPENFYMPHVIESVYSTAKTLALKKGISIEKVLDEKVSFVVADEIRVKQILYNLVSNAIKFTPDKGRVLIASRRITDGFDSIEISVKDTGIGIAPEDFDKIFASFQQIDGSYSRKQEGTGLGLSLTKKLVELHGGRIWFESEVGKGSTFYVTIPINGLKDEKM